MIQPEPEDLPKDNPKLEIAVLRHNMRMLVKDTRSQDGKDDKDNDKGSKSRSQANTRNSSLQQRTKGVRLNQDHMSLTTKAAILNDPHKGCHPMNSLLGRLLALQNIAMILRT
ncbi:hypothetical protein Tco_1106920 [Tanacetum coccineum]